jgi:hypothetical protein
MPAFQHERETVLAVLPPLSSSGTRDTSFVKATGTKVQVKFYVGANSAAGTIRLRRASDADGTGAENASATVAYGGTSTTGDNVLHVLEVNPVTYATDAKPYLSVQIAAGGTYVSSVIVSQLDTDYVPGDDVTAVNVLTAPAVA